MASCEICGKHAVFGNNVARDRGYINERTPRKIKPNLQRATFEINGTKKQLTVCTRCKRSANKIRQ